MISQTTIPRREPELIEAEARQFYRGDTEKVATTSLQSVTARGVEITSRYNKAEEFELMAKMVNALPASRRYAARSNRSGATARPVSASPLCSMPGTTNWRVRSAHNCKPRY
jgi:hypothetical protein